MYVKNNNMKITLRIDSDNCERCKKYIDIKLYVQIHCKEEKRIKVNE